MSSTVLIVDDEERNCRLLEAVLSGRGYRLEFARDGAQALAQAAALVPDLILLDVMMPEIDGLEVCKRIRADLLLQDIPIVLVTALDDKGSRLKGIEAGADDFVSKPIDQVELRARVQTITRLNRSRRLQAERAKFKLIADQSADGYVQLNAEGEILYANAQGRVCLGLPPDPHDVSNHFMALARKRYSLQPPEAWQDWPLQDSRKEQPIRYLLRPETKSERALWLRVLLLPTPTAAQEPLLQLRDVTAELAAQRDMWRFQSMLSHKLRTPLVGLISSLDYLGDGFSTLPAREVEELVRTASQCASRLQGAIRDVLDFSDSTAPAEVGDEPGFPVAGLTGMATQIAARLGIKEITTALETGLESAELPLGHGTMDIVLTELLENAKKFHPSLEPAITITAFRAEPGRVAVRVADDGRTLPADEIPHVWKPYYQVEKAFTGEVAGMGLGLPMVASLVLERGGRCQMANRQPGPGVVVEISLPLAA